MGSNVYMCTRKSYPGGSETPLLGKPCLRGQLNDTILPIGKSLFERGKEGQSNRRFFTAPVGHGQICVNEVCFIKS